MLVYVSFGIDIMINVILNTLNLGLFYMFLVLVLFKIFSAHSMKNVIIEISE